MPSIIRPSRPRSMGLPTSTRDSPSRLTSRSESPSTLSGDRTSTSFPWILHHILERQLSSELPLRIMFSFNAGEQLPTLKQAHEWWQYDPKGKLIIEFLSSLPQMNPSHADLALSNAKKEQIRNSNWGKLDDIDPEFSDIDRFMDMHHDLLFDIDFDNDLDHKAKKSSGFPLTLIRQMCLKTVFRADYREAEFNQALTALDYLRDLECTRRTALRDAAVRLGITSETWKEVLSEEQEAYAWVESAQKQELEIESYYANVFIDLRIWTMVHILQSEPFYKPNVLAMLNTLFPPSMKDLPNDRIDINALKKYRATLYQHILTVEAKGSGVVKEFVQQLLKPEAKHSWASARQNLEKYIELADVMIRQANTVRGNDRDSLRHSRTISGANSAFSERPSTASSANTTWSGQQSPTLPILSSNPKSAKPSRSRLSNRADTARLFQSQPSSPTLVPQPLQPSTFNPGRNNPKQAQVQGMPPPITSNERRSGASRPPTKPVPPLPRSKTDLRSTPRPEPPYQPRNPEPPPRPPRSPPTSPRHKSHSIPAPHHSQVAFAAHNQTIPNSPLSSSFFPEELVASAKMGKSGTRPNTPTIPTLKQLESDNGDFLTRPYSPYGETTSLEPAMKKKSSMTNIFGLRKSSDATSIKGKDSSISLRSSKSSKPTESFPLYSEPESDLQMGKLKKEKSKPSLRGDHSRRSSIDMKRSTTWQEGASNSIPNKLTLTKSKTSEGSSFEDALSMAPPKKTKGWKNSLGRARGALRGRNKSSPKKAEFEPEEYKEPVPKPYEISRADPASHPPSAPSSPTAAMFATELNLPDRDSLRRTKSFGEGKAAKPTKPKGPPPPTPKFPHPNPATLSRPATAPHVDSLPSSYLIYNTPLPLSEDYDLLRAREYTRKSLIAKAYAEKNELDSEFEKPRTPPVPQSTKRAKEFAREVGWVPFEMPRATPKTPRERVEVSRFSK